MLHLPGIGKRRFANWNGCLIFRNQTCALNIKTGRKLFINAGITIGTQGERRQCLINRCGKPGINADGDISPATSAGMPEPGWGRITDSHQWNTLLSLHNAQFYLLQRTPEVARSRATPLLDLIKTALTPHPPQKQAYGVTLPTSVLFIAGHDTHLANLGGALELNWTLPVDRITRRQVVNWCLNAVLLGER